MATRTRFKSSSPAPSSLSTSTTMTLDPIAAAAATPHPQQTNSTTTTTTTTALPPSNFQQRFPPQTQVHHHPYPNAGHLYHHHAHPRGPPPRLDDYVAAKILPEDPTKRFSSTPDNAPLAILNFHNAVPRNYGNHSVPSCGPVPVVLPPPIGGAGGGGRVNGVGSVGHVLGQPPASSYGAHHEPREGEDAIPQFGYRKNENSYHRYAPTEKSRSLSIQSLISSPELSPPTSYSNNDGQSGTRKRKGSDGDVGGSHGTRSGSIVSTTVTMDDPEVREVVEALGGLKGDFTATSPTTTNHQLPPHQHNPSGVAEQQQPQHQHPEHEPLINLITSSAQRAHPLISSVITTGLSAYGASKSYSPSFRYAAESVESRVGVPVGNVVSAVGRQTGLDSALRRGLGGNRRGSSGGEQRADTKKRKTNNKSGDLEKGEESLKALAQQQQQQQRQQQQNTLARMSDRDNQTLDAGANDRQVAAPNQTWPTRVVLSTYGFGAALNEESLKNLKYCLDWLRFLNAHLGKLVSALKNVVEELDDHQRSQMGEDRQANGGIARALPTSYENSRAILAAKVENLKGDVVATMKKVVEVVSNYTGSALPENARELIKRHIFALPQRFQAANASEIAEKEKDGPMSSASRALVLAKEGLDMMQQVSDVVEGTIDRAEEWCERLGRKKREDDGQSGEEGKKGEWVEGRRDGDGDVKMEKA